MTRTALAWHNMTHRRGRTITALAGVTMAIHLIFLQLGFYRATFTSSMMAFMPLRYDLLLTSPLYLLVRQPGFIHERHGYQAQSVAGVESVDTLLVGVARVRIPPTGVRREILVFGIDPHGKAFALEAVVAQQDRLSVMDTALVDTKVGPGYDRVQPGTAMELNSRLIDFVGSYFHGTGFSANASVVVSTQTFRRIFPTMPVRTISLGLVRISRGADPAAVKQRLVILLGPDVRVQLASEHREAELDYSLNVKPVGIMFTSGVLLAFVVGAAILYQILASEVAHHLREFATLKAMGYSANGVRLVIWQQAVLFALLGFVPAFVLSFAAYELINATTTLPTEMTLQRVITVLGITVLMCSIAGLLAARKLDRADPADLF